jgi:hypothetical protein
MMTALVLPKSVPTRIKVSNLASTAIFGSIYLQDALRRARMFARSQKARSSVARMFARMFCRVPRMSPECSCSELTAKAN